MEDSSGLDLLDKFLHIDPAARIDCDAAPNHYFFWVDPLPCERDKVVSQYTRSTFEYDIRDQNRLGIAAHVQH